MRYNSNVISYFTPQDGHASDTIFRQPTIGPELDIVKAYCEEHLTNLDTPENLSIFMEPKLDSGFPDIVAVIWNNDVAKHWPQKRELLTNTDMELVHHVNLVGRLPVSKLIKRFGTRKTSEAMLRISDAQIADVTSDEIIKRPIEEVFAVQRIIAIEAKIKDWNSGLQQAFQNTLFASESYLLLSALPNSKNLFDTAKKLGVGILDKHSSVYHPHLQSRIGDLPTSHAAWLFNEWAWRFSSSCTE